MMHLPSHIAIIMDGNGRWAQQRGLPRSEGHRAGVRAVKSIVTECRTLGIRYLTLYAFSRENWGRPKEEVSLLFGLLVSFLGQELPSMLENGIQLRVIGDAGALPVTARTALNHAIKKTAQCSDMTVNLALNYSGRDEILRAVRTLLANGTPADSLSEDMLSAAMYTSGQPDPDLIIRTSGEYRLSNFLLYQSAYSELYFTPVLWPDFDTDALHKALSEFAQRSRRFGLTQEQIEAGTTDQTSSGAFE